MPYEAGSVEEATTIFKSERMLASMRSLGVRGFKENRGRSIYRF